MSSVKQVYGGTVNIAVQVCAPILTQATCQKIQSLGRIWLPNTWTTNSFVISSVYAGLDAAVSSPLDCLAQPVVLADGRRLLQYLAETYVDVVSHPVGDIGQLTRHTWARLPPVLWNVHQTTLTDGNRTNNVSEVWNNQLRSTTSQYHDHRTLWTVMMALHCKLTLPK